MKSIVSVLALLSVIGLSSAIKCFNCNKDTECLDPFQSSSSAARSYITECGPDSENECVKVSFSAQDKTTTFRSCAKKGNKDMDGCKAVIETMKLTNAFGVSVDTKCNLCNTDLCNLGTSSVASVCLVLSALFLKFFV